jgi:hypothetical protein
MSFLVLTFIHFFLFWKVGGELEQWKIIKDSIMVRARNHPERLSLRR